MMKVKNPKLREHSRSADLKAGITLGISWGKATARLNNMILFKLVQETNRDICYRCGQKISCPTDLSRDHKTDWTTAEEYWDLDNIAFSHKQCNRIAGLERGRSIRRMNK